MPRPDTANRVKLAGLIAAAVPIGLGCMLIQALSGAMRTEDCVMSGR